MSIWFGVLTLKSWSPEWYEWGCYRQKANKQAQIKSLVTIVVVRDILFWLEPGMYLYFRLFSVQISIGPIWAFKDEARVGGERILRPKDYVIKSWQLETVVLLRYFEGNRINQDHNAF